MDTISAASSLNQLPRHKILHLVRHAQGVHNLESMKSRDPLTSFEFLDAELSSLGWQQVCDQRKDVCASDLLEGIEVVITSPMTRTLQTAVGIFLGEDQADGRSDGRSDVTSSIEDEKAKSGETSIFNRLPIIANEICRERMDFLLAFLSRKSPLYPHPLIMPVWATLSSLHKGGHECDKRRSTSHYRSRFPAVDFSLIENEEDILWKANEKETDEAVIARVTKFIKWLWERKEEEIAVVSHGVFLQKAMIELIRNKKLVPLSRDYDPCSRFKNCEMRSVILFNESVMGLGSDSLATNNCGRNRISYGIEMQRDCAKTSISLWRNWE